MRTQASMIAECIQKVQEELEQLTQLGTSSRRTCEFFMRWGSSTGHELLAHRPQTPRSLESARSGWTIQGINPLIASFSFTLLTLRLGYLQGVLSTLFQQLSAAMQILRDIDEACSRYWRSRWTLMFPDDVRIPKAMWLMKQFWLSGIKS